MSVSLEWLWFGYLSNLLVRSPTCPYLGDHSGVASNFGIYEFMDSVLRVLLPRWKCSGQTLLSSS